MNIVFIGGGSLRLLPILRGVFKCHKGVFDQGEIRLVDRDISRAELVGKMIMKCPEYRELSSCKISWGDNLDEMLPGADVLYVTMAVGNRLNYHKALGICERLGFLAGDQLSPEGAVLSLIGGSIILEFARKMEKHCPDAMMLIFANPVAVYSGMVNNHSKIRALGICGGYANHRYDLTRIIFGENKHRDGYDIDAAGVNHCSLIMGGTYEGEDIFKLLDNALTPDWQPPEECNPCLKFTLSKMVEMYKKTGTMVFSTEGDGFAHLCYDESRAAARKCWGSNLDKTEEELIEGDKKHSQMIKAAYAKCHETVARDLEEDFWQRAAQEFPHFGMNELDVTLPILSALAGLGPEKIVASQPNNGAVRAFKDRTVMEYSILVDENGARPAGDYEIPDTFHGLMSALATHQTLLGDAVASKDPKILAQAVFAYPILQGTEASKQVWTELLDLFADEYPAELHGALKYL